MRALLWKSTKYLLFFLAGLVVLISVFWLEEDWRGARAWAACQKEMAARGEILDLRHLAPPGDPKDDLSKVPIFAEVYQKEPAKPSRLARINTYLGVITQEPDPALSHYLKGEPLDLVAWQKYYRAMSQAKLPPQPGTPAEDVLHALDQLNPDLHEIEVAVSNPNAFWPIDYDFPVRTPLSGQTKMIALAKILQLRGVAHLENKQTDLALQDYQLSFAINRTLSQNGFLISQLVRIAVRAIDNGILWEGLHRHAWTADQLQAMQASLVATDDLGEGKRTLQRERMYWLTDFDLYNQAHTQDHSIHDVFYFLDDDSEWFLGWNLRLRPSGWWDQEKCYSTYLYQHWIDSLNTQNGRIEKNKIVEPSKTAFDLLYHPLSCFALSPVSICIKQFAEGETKRRLAYDACALELYYLQHQQYPEKLADVGDLPPHLDREVLTGQPFHYARKGNGYTLYSTGWDETDHGGKPRGVDASDNYDWVWPGP